MVVAAIGIVVNLASALLFAKGSKADLNLRAAFMHLMADAVVSASVVFAGLAIVLTGQNWIDPVTSLIITVGLAWGSGTCSRTRSRWDCWRCRAISMSRQCAAFLAGQDGGHAVHDLHIWGMSTTESALTAHLVMPGGQPGDPFLRGLAEELEQRFGIHHATIQIERDADCAAGCAE